MPSLKILLIHNFYRTAGGEENYLESLSKLLGDNNHKVLVYSKSNKIIPKGFSPRVKIALAMFWNQEVYKELSKVIQKFKPDVAHFSNIYPLISPTAYYACKKAGVPIIQSIHNFRYMFPKSLLIRRGAICPYCLEKRFVYPAFIHRCYGEPLFYTAAFSLSHTFHYLIGSFAKVNKFIFPSRFARNYYLKYSGIPKKKTVFLPNFIWEEKLKNRRKENYFLFAGRLSKEKGILGLLGTFSSNPQINLYVAGDGLLKREVNSFSGYKNIKILGSVSRRRVLELMQGALATLIPSLCWEVFPSVLIESFLAATPVVVPNLGVFKETVREGETGFFFKANDFSDLGDKLTNIKKSKRLKQMGLKCRREYSEKYTRDIYYRKLISVYLKETKIT